MTTYTLLSADLQSVKSDHQIVRIEHPLLSRPLLVTARFSPKTVTWKEADQWAGALTLGGHSWRLPGVEEAFFIPNRAKYPAWDPNVFLGATDRYPWIWTSTPDAEEPAGDAWFVYLHYGGSARFHRGYRGLALAVLAGQ